MPRPPSRHGDVRGQRSGWETMVMAASLSSSGQSPADGQLSPPALHVRESFLLALDEYHREGLHTDLSAKELTDPKRFLSWVERMRIAGSSGQADCERDRVPHIILWWTAGPQYVGRARINFALNDQLREFGGHIGYDVRPSARKQGHATAILASALLVARQQHIELALLTCAPDNAASRRVIERNGGKLTDVSPSGRLRYWCPTG
jgi:predicted acetyltransferase